MPCCRHRGISDDGYPSIIFQYAVRIVNRRNQFTFTVPRADDLARCQDPKRAAHKFMFMKFCSTPRLRKTFANTPHVSSKMRYIHSEETLTVPANGEIDSRFCAYAEEQLSQALPRP